MSRSISIEIPNIPTMVFAKLGAAQSKRGAWLDGRTPSTPTMINKRHTHTHTQKHCKQSEHIS